MAAYFGWESVAAATVAARLTVAACVVLLRPIARTTIEGNFARAIGS